MSDYVYKIVARQRIPDVLRNGLWSSLTDFLGGLPGESDKAHTMALYFDSKPASPSPNWVCIRVHKSVVPDLRQDAAGRWHAATKSAKKKVVDPDDLEIWWKRAWLRKSDFERAAEVRREREAISKSRTTESYSRSAQMIERLIIEKKRSRWLKKIQKIWTPPKAELMALSGYSRSGIDTA